MSPSTNASRLALALAATGLLGACAAVGPDFAAPQPPKTAGYAMAGDAAPAQARLDGAAAAGPWWTALGSPALDRTVRQALSDSPTLAEADATLGQAQAALAAARGGLAPQVDLTAGANRERANLQAFGFSGGFGGVALSNPTFSLYSLGGSVGYDLDLFGGRRRRVESAAAQAEAQARRADAAYLTLTGNVALQAATIAALRAQIAAVERMVAADEQNLELARRANALGGAASTAKVAAQTQLESDRTQLPGLRSQLGAARHALALLVGRAPADWTAPEFDLAEFDLDAAVPVSLPSQLVRKRPDILAAEAELHAATADVGAATADLYPDIKLTASLTQGAISPGDIFSYDSSAWNLGAGLTAPIFHGGELQARRRQAVEAVRAADARYRQTVLTAFVQVGDALQALADDGEAIAAQTRAEAQAAESLRLAKIAFDKGGGTMIDVLDAQRQLNQAQAARMRLQGQRLADLVRLFAASGADWRGAGKG